MPQSDGGQQHAAGVKPDKLVDCDPQPTKFGL
jgi:hypothetical protein